MNKNRKKFYIFGLLIALFLIGIFSFLYNKESHSVDIPQEYHMEVKPLQKEIPTIKSNPKTEIESIIVKETPVNENTKNTLISLNVFDKSYSIKIEEGISVYDAMKSAENNGFSFKATKYPSLGYFVEEINGVKGTPGKYWIYYVNNQKASVGISNYILKSGDSITWKQEGI